MDHMYEHKQDIATL